MIADEIRAARINHVDAQGLWKDTAFSTPDPVKVIKLKAINGFFDYLINLEAINQNNKINELRRLTALANEWLDSVPSDTQTVIIKDNECLTIVKLKESNARVT